MTTYLRGYGGYTLTASQYAELQLLLDQQSQAFKAGPATVGLGAPIYQTLLNDISADVGGPLGVSPAVDSWLNGALGINSASGFAAQFIRDYTVDQLQLREGAAQDAFDRVQRASNQIALSLAQDILDNHGELPGISGLGAIDAGAAASDVFNVGIDPADYAGWAGTLLFPYLGESAFYQDWLLNDQPFLGYVEGNPNLITFKHTPGTYDLVASIEAAGQAGAAAGEAAPFSALWQAIFGPSGAVQTDQSSLISETNQFFQNYYSLPSDSGFLPGNDLAFSSGYINYVTGAFNHDQYVVGTLANDSTLSAQSGYYYTTIVGGPGNDVIHGTASGADLIDGGGGNNTICVGTGKSIVFGGGYGTNVIFGNSKQNPYVLDILVGGPGGTDPGTGLGQTAPGTQADPAAGDANDTITAGSGDDIMIGGAGKNTFNIYGGNQYSTNMQIIWGGGGTSSYNFLDDTGFNSIFVLDIPKPTVGLISKLTPGDVRAMLPTSTSGTETVIIDPTDSDSLSVNGVKFGSAAYQLLETDDEWAVVYTGGPEGTQTIWGVPVEDVPPIGSVDAYGHTVIDAFHAAYLDGYGYGSNGATYHPYYETPASGPAYDSLDISAPTEGIPIFNFTNGEFGIDLTGNGPSVVVRDALSGYTAVMGGGTPPPAADPRFFSYTGPPATNIVGGASGGTIDSGAAACTSGACGCDRRQRLAVWHKRGRDLRRPRRRRLRAGQRRGRHLCVRLRIRSA